MHTYHNLQTVSPTLSIPTTNKNMFKVSSSPIHRQRIGGGSSNGYLSSSPMKRKRDDCNDEISNILHDEYIMPLNKRAAFSSNALSAFRCYDSSSTSASSSFDSEHRDEPDALDHTSSSLVDDDIGSSSNAPNDNDDVLDDETAALVSNFRTSVFRSGQATTTTKSHPISPLSSTPSLLACSSLHHEGAHYDDGSDDDDEDEGNSSYPDLQSIVRARTIHVDDSSYDDGLSSSSSSTYLDPPDMLVSSRRTSPQEEEKEEILEHKDGYYNHSLASSEADHFREHDDGSCHIEEKNAPTIEGGEEEAREHPPAAWLISSSSSTLPMPRSSAPVWIMPSTTATNKREDASTSFWPANWNSNGMFHQGSA